MTEDLPLKLDPTLPFSFSFLVKFLGQGVVGKKMNEFKEVGECTYAWLSKYIDLF